MIEMHDVDALADLRIVAKPILNIANFERLQICYMAVKIVSTIAFTYYGQPKHHRKLN